MNLADSTRDFLLHLARRSIAQGLAMSGPAEPDLSACPPEALVARACFVTLTMPGDELRGCRGMLEPRRPLAVDVWHNAWASAFDDPRFEPVTLAEARLLRLEISVLGPLEPVRVASEQELHQVLVPERDGVVLAWRDRRATFLPQVWEDLPDPREFLAHLKNKAGLPADFWATDVEVQRYRVAKLRERVPAR